MTTNDNSLSLNTIAEHFSHSS